MSKSPAVASPQDLIGRNAQSYAPLQLETSSQGDPLSTSAGSVRSIDMRLEKQEVGAEQVVAKIKLIDNRLIELPVTPGMNAA